MDSQGAAEQPRVQSGARDRAPSSNPHEFAVSAQEEEAPPPASATGEAGRGSSIQPDRRRRSRWSDVPLPASPTPADGRGGGAAHLESTLGLVGIPQRRIRTLRRQSGRDLPTRAETSVALLL